MTIARLAAVLITAEVVLVACAFPLQSADEEAANIGQRARYLASSVQGFIRYENPLATLSGGELLRLATKDDPKQLSELSDYFVDARREGANSSVLVCDRDRRQALVEDTACTTIVDRTYGRDTPAACRFQINLEQVCKARP